MQPTTDPGVTPDVTPGWTTTEFWLTLGSTVLSAFTALMALFHPGFHLDPRAQQFAVAFAPIAASIGALAYAFSRAHVKSAAIQLKAVRADLEANSALREVAAREAAARTEESKARTAETNARITEPARPGRRSPTRT